MALLAAVLCSFRKTDKGKGSRGGKTFDGGGALERRLRLSVLVGLLLLVDGMVVACCGVGNRGGDSGEGLVNSDARR